MLGRCQISRLSHANKCCTSSSGQGLEQLFRFYGNGAKFRHSSSNSDASSSVNHQPVQSGLQRSDSGRRYLSTESTIGSDSSHSMLPRKSVWDDIFQDIHSSPPALPFVSRGSPAPRRVRRQSMTAREIRAFDDMFDMIFDSTSPAAVSRINSESSPGIEKGGVNDLFGKLRLHSKKMKWTTELDELLDKKKEEMNLCHTDQTLLDWAITHVFGESEQYLDAATRAIDATKTGTVKELPMLQPPTYPYTIALLMRVFRDQYKDPHLALAIFDHARHLSIASYVFGCQTNAYNELIKTRWLFFRDLGGIRDALEEMLVNGVEMDSQTRKIVESLRRDIGASQWLEGQELARSDAWNILARIETIISSLGTKEVAKTNKPLKWSDWKAHMSNEQDDEWHFDRWGEDRDRLPPRKVQTKLSSQGRLLQKVIC